MYFYHCESFVGASFSPPLFHNHRRVALFAYPSSPPRSCWRQSLGGFVIDQPSRVSAESRALFCPSSEPLFHDHRCVFLTPFATAFVPRSSVQELRRRILSSVREHHRCTFLTAFTIAFVVQELRRCILPLAQELLWCILLTSFAPLPSFHDHQHESSVHTSFSQSSSCNYQLSSLSRDTEPF